MMVKRTKKERRNNLRNPLRRAIKKDPRWKTCGNRPEKYLLINTAGKSTIRFLKRREKSTYQTNF